jgi:hypothetical protein
LTFLLDWNRTIPGFRRDATCGSVCSQTKIAAVHSGCAVMLTRFDSPQSAWWARADRARTVLLPRAAFLGSVLRAAG